MKIITRKKQLETEKIIAACLYIIGQTSMEISSMDKLIENLADINYNIGGLRGMSEVQSLRKQLESRL